MKIFVSGATGYIGGRLVPLLLKKGYQVVASGRSLEKLQNRAWSYDSLVTLKQVDVFDFKTLQKALEGCDAAYYLVHSMTHYSNFSEKDRQAAIFFTAACEHANVQRIVYLSGLGSEKDRLSDHLESRQEVASILENSSVPVTVLRAAMIIGSGSASFEILRHLVSRLPIMITPRWVRTLCQPIAVKNALHYLVEVLEHDQTIGKTYDIGGPEVLTYQQLMDLYAQEAKLKPRVVIPVFCLTPKLSSYWIGLVTPVPTRLGRALVEGLKNPVICENDTIRSVISQDLLTPKQAIDQALEKDSEDLIVSSWTDSGEIPDASWLSEDDPAWVHKIKIEKHTIIIQAPIEDVWKAILKIGGKTGWYSPQFLWVIRGWIDKCLGGVGLSRGRRSVDELRVGDAVDFWRVKTLNPPHHLVLLAEMKIPGQAALEFICHKISENKTKMMIKAKFLPRGFGGYLYWWSVSIFHRWIFSSMLKFLSQAVNKSVKE